jgi:hypothetical protein
VSRSRMLVVPLVLALVTTGLSWLPAARPSAALATDGPIAHWTFDEGSGTTVIDETGNGHIGSFVGTPTWVTSGVAVGSGALAFDGSGDGVLVPDSPALEPTSLTISLWVKGSGVPADGIRRTLVEKGSNGCEGSSWGVGALIGSSYGAFGGAIDQPGTTPSETWVDEGGRLWDGDWHHIAVTYDAQTGDAFSYFDGRRYRVNGAPPTYGLPGTDDLLIGYEPADCMWRRHYAGMIDDIQIYDRALSEPEIGSFTTDVATTTTFDPGADPVFFAQGTPVSVGVSPAPAPHSFVRLYRVNDGAHTLVGSGPLRVSGQGEIQLNGNTLPHGTNLIRAEFEGAGAYQASMTDVVAVEVIRRPNVATISADDSTPAVGQAVELTATILGYADTVTFTDLSAAGGPAVLGTAKALSSEGVYSASLTLSSLTLGSHQVVASTEVNDHYEGALSDPLAIDVGKVETMVLLGLEGVQYTKHPFAVHAYLRRPGDPSTEAADATGTLSVYDNGVLIGSKSPQAGTASFSFSGLSAGSHTLKLAYSGDATYASGESETKLEILPDIVESTGVGVSATTFYPYKDGYRDSVAIKGNRQEPASVSIRVYSPSGTLVRSASVPKATGSYSYAWNGRTSSGSQLAAGKYKVVQTLTDATATKRTVTSYVTLSSKRLVYTSTTIERTYSQASKRTSSWIAWQFTVPAATVYKSMVFSVYGRSRTVPGGSIGAQDFAVCPYSTYWSPTCVTRSADLGISTAWYSRSLHTTYDRHGRYVRGYAWADYAGTAQVSRARLKVTYGVLK